ncbi:MAG: hypothetical protein A2538_03180 [Candidatus Magasanikbacteria bacterium RIFOXYD2_FULL_41_14]|uniref:30S ribosomal protein S21 n=1 Tax=Candidatus Magasanikbacteria bacterium RIFOXYD2_FULL_41_14 TaxID=1798709 RepID=A0A1F6PD18_9BACT|nr:MAG: hypothetical protein A2538_03180 [Candidatus Magasanikbacteria bacterium RIFOXYD2_FULL_41_14]
MRRVKKRWQQSGKILQVKKIKFFDQKKNKTARKRSAIHRIETTAKIEYLKKIGRLPETPNTHRR